MAGGGSISTSETKIEAVRLQSSVYGAAIPLLYGVNRIPGNMLWYGGFKATAKVTKQRAGKGGGTTTKNTTYSYSAHVAMGLCEGPIIGIPRVWVGKAIESGGLLGTNVLTTTHAYTPPGGGGAVTVTNSATWLCSVAVSYQGAIDVGDGATTGPVYLAEGTDYTVAGGIYTFGAVWAAVPLTIEYQYRSGGTEAALAKLGLTKFLGTVGQGTWSLLTSSFTAQAIPYSGIAYVAAQDYPLPDATVQNHNFEVQARMAYHLGSTVPDVDVALAVLDVLTNPRYGAGFPAARVNVALWSKYVRAAGLLMSPAITEQSTAAEVLRTAGMLTNTAPVWSAGALKMMPYGDTALTGNGATYTPNVTPLYALNDDVFLPSSGGGEPVAMSLKPRADAYNHIRIEYLDRSADYNVAVAEAKDQADIDANGLRSADVLVAHWIADGTTARAVAQLLLQRSLYVRAVYKFRLPWTFALLEPMDLVTLTDAGLGLSSAAVRVLQVEESEDGQLDVEAEEFPVGVAAAATYTPQVGGGYSANYNAAPGNVSTPVLFEAPAELTTTGLEVYAAVTGVGADWGGCNVWVSLDGTNYVQAGTVYGGVRYGSLTAAISAGNLPVSILAGQLVAASAADAAALSSLCYIGGATPEYLAHQGATLTGTLAYTLSGLVRAAYGTTSTAHAASDPFVRVDTAALGKSGALPLSMVGKTISFKFTSFNVYGNAEQDLASVSAYNYTITGYMASRGTARPKLVKVTADRQTITLDGSGALSPSTQTTTFTVTGQNLTTGTYTVSLARTDGTVVNANTYLTGSGTIGAVGNSFTMTGTTVTLTAANFQTARSTATGLLVTIAHADGVQDTVQLVRVQDGAAGAAGSAGAAGAAGVSVGLTVEALALPAYADGSVVSFASANGLLKVYSGSTDVTASATLSASASGCTGTINTATGTPVAAQPAGYYQVTAMSADVATLTLTAVYNSQTYVRTFTITKAKYGYEIVSTLPSTNLFAGRIVYLTTDSKLYRYVTSPSAAWTVEVDGADVKAGSITAAKLAVTQLSALAADVGTLTAGVIRNSGDTFRIDVTNGRTITQNGAYMKVTGIPFGSTSQFIEWYGPYQASLSTCTEANATYYLRTDGVAYFGGALLAGILKNSVQATNLTSANVADLGPFSSNGGTITVTVGFVFQGRNNFAGTAGGESAYTAQSKVNPTFTLVLSRSINGGAFTDVATYNVTGSWTGVAPVAADSAPGFYAQNAGYSATYTDPSTIAQNRQYKLRFTGFTVNTGVLQNTLSLQSVE